MLLLESFFRLGRRAGTEDSEYAIDIDPSRTSTAEEG
jgi:multicomponent K+:H+ antiporter subunit A